MASDAEIIRPTSYSKWKRFVRGNRRYFPMLSVCRHFADPPHLYTVHSDCMLVIMRIA